jgi:hypothetical protein
MVTPKPIFIIKDDLIENYTQSYDDMKAKHMPFEFPYLIGEKRRRDWN